MLFILIRCISFRITQRDDGLILPTSYASALRLVLGATHLVVFYTTLVEQSSSACLQASLQTRSASIIGAGNNPMVGMTVAVAVAIEEASK